MSTSLVHALRRTRRSHIERRVEVGGVSVRYIESGVSNPGPPLILIHGFQSGADLWYPHTFSALATERHVIALDLPGFAYSDRLASYSTDAYGTFMNAFLDTLGYSEIDLLGHSMGGQIAIATAAARPERVRRLILVASAGLTRPDSLLASLAMLVDRGAFHFRLYPALARLMLRAAARRDCIKMLKEDTVYGLLSDLNMPTLIVWGSRDRVVPLEHATIFARAIPNARLYIMRGCGHMPHYQKHAQFEKAVLHFLSQ
jgi:pimeloyl-ACP methyl ester carboxylesterase